MTDETVKMSVKKLSYEAPKLQTQEIDLEYGIAQTSGLRNVDGENREWLGDW